MDIEQAMQSVGVISPVPLKPTKPQLASSSGQLNSTKSQLDSTASVSSTNLVDSSLGLVDPSLGLVDSSGQLGQLNSTKSQLAGQLNSTKNQQGNYLSELGQQAKGELEVLVATGKTKDLLGKQLTQLELDALSEKEILKKYRIYESAMASRINDSFGKMALKSYCKLANYVLPIDSEDDLYNDLRNDYILVNEIDRWAGWLSLKMGSFMALASTSLITFAHCLQKENIHIINGGEPTDSTEPGNNSSE